MILSQIMKPIPYSKQKIDSLDIEAVRQVLASDFVTQGPKIDEFEQAFAKYCGAKYAVAVASGTAALHLAALACGLKKGDQAITTPITFLATANCVLYTGARPIFADIDYDTVNIDPSSIRKLINKNTKAILPVDFSGLPARMEEIYRVAKSNGLVVIEDASHALGARYRGNKVGACRHSDMAIFSFHPVKHMTTGEGGCITTNNKKYYEQLKVLRNHGIYRKNQTQRKQGSWYYEMEELGFNYRITDFQCALGLSQLAKVDEFINRRVEIANQYNESFADMSRLLRVPPQLIVQEKHVWHLYLLRLKLRNPLKTRKRLFDHLKSNGINPQVHYIPIYRQPFYQKLWNGKKINCPNAERYYEEVISLPMFPTLTEGEFDKTVSTVKQFLTHKL